MSRNRSCHITAYHEAGHTVAAIVLDVGFEKVTIVGDEVANGRIIYEDPDPEITEAWEFGDRADPAVIEWAEKSIIVAFAGAAAQRRFAPRSHWRYAQTGEYELPNFGKVVSPHSDLSKVIRMIDDMGRSDDAVYYKELEARAEALVEKNWPLIVKLADTLVWQKTMYADDVCQLLFGSFDEVEDEAAVVELGVDPDAADNQQTTE